MPQQPASATRIKLCDINSDLIGRKLRVAGRVLSYDVNTGLIVLVDGKEAVLVDISLALDFHSKVWATDRLSTIMAIGDLESSDAPLEIPSTASPHVLALKISNQLVLRAILVIPSPNLDLGLWKAVLDEEEESQS
ncbi:hypothetical protein CPB83DRAFT_794417 [Crepidotus variabilis]|uniref:Uncharacterized protein n=1 Tax=Crepidotus variabilis TaxID=179855 RepID=A0A9P6JMX9_9AGAR|nr:hypothetical protein CPB83DRAFT_794417 [Crepidotus variabilis]